MIEPLPTAPAHHPLGPRLHAMTDRLAGVDRMTEQAFLRIGWQVGAGQRRAVALTELTEQALQPDENETAEQTVVRLRLLTERTALWLTEAGEQSRTICAILNMLERHVAALAVPLRGLAKVVKMLQTLRVATRIEAARSHGHGALVLGAELHQLGSLMHEQLEQVAGRCEVLATLCRRATTMEEEARLGPLQEAEGEIRHARLLLDTVAGQCLRTAGYADRLRQRAAELADNYGELIAALQFQDITRQRLHHIRGALDGLGAALSAPGGEEPAVGEICCLQHDQLNLAVGEFCEAVERLDCNLRGMANGIRALADDARAALTVGSDEHSARIAPSLQAVNLCLENVRTTHLAAGQAIFAVCQAVRDVAMLTGEIERLGEEMQLLAQNAAVSAAHGSARAAGLTVIAGNIQALAEEAVRHAAAMAAGCQRINDQAEELDSRDQQSDHGEAGLEELVTEARTLIGRLEGGSQVLDARIETIGRHVAELGEEMKALLADFDIRRQFLAQSDPVLEELRATAREYGAATRDADNQRTFLSLQDRYTMMSERDVHQRFLQRRAGQQLEDARTAPFFAAGSLGSNVELF